MTSNSSLPGQFCIVVTGLPGSGKTTLGHQAAALLDLPMLDKDAYLEALFEQYGTGDLQWRQRLSRESDGEFRKDAESLEQVVLVSHWRPLDAKGNSGTPCAWLAAAFPLVIELFCQCPVGEAAGRFSGRSRHPGHADTARPENDVIDWMYQYSEQLPLSLGALVTMDTSKEVDQNLLHRKLCEALNRGPGITGGKG